MHNNTTNTGLILRIVSAHRDTTYASASVCSCCGICVVNGEEQLSTPLLHMPVFAFPAERPAIHKEAFELEKQLLYRHFIM